MTVEISDETISQEFTFNLAEAGQCYRRKDRPVNRRRQKIIRFLGREGDIERFTVHQTFPIVGSLNSDLPSPRQIEAVEHFFGRPPQSRWQAHTMLSARDYGLEVASRYRFTAMRRIIISVAVTAFLLGDPKLRDDVRRWCEARNREPSPGISSGIANHRPYKTAGAFAEKMIKDLRGAGSDAFG